METVRERRSKGSKSKGKIKNERVGQRNHYLKGISGLERAEIRQTTGIKLRTTASLLGDIFYEDYITSIVPDMVNHGVI